VVDTPHVRNPEKYPAEESACHDVQPNNGDNVSERHADVFDVDSTSVADAVESACYCRFKAYFALSIYYTR